MIYALKRIIAEMFYFLFVFVIVILDPNLVREQREVAMCTHVHVCLQIKAHTDAYMRTCAHIHA